MSVHIVQSRMKEPYHFVYPMAVDGVDPVRTSRAAIAAFIQRTGISTCAVRPDPHRLVEKRVRDIVKTWDVDIAYAHKFNKNLRTGIDMGAVYSHNTIDTQVHIAVFTVLATCLDEYEIDASAVEEFTSRLLRGSPQGHPLLQYFAENLSSMNKFFLPFACNAIVSSALSFINQNLLDKHCERFPVHEAALRYAEGKRIKNGMAEAYTLFIWEKVSFPDIQSYIQAVPDVMLPMDYINDIFSFYKEELAVETNNYVHNRARVTNRSVEAALLDTVDDTVAAVENARFILQTDAEIKALESFLVGYTAFHIHSPRYRVLELTGKEYM